MSAALVGGPAKSVGNGQTEVIAVGGGGFVEKERGDGIPWAVGWMGKLRKEELRGKPARSSENRIVLKRNKLRKLGYSKKNSKRCGAGSTRSRDQ